MPRASKNRRNRVEMPEEWARAIVDNFNCAKGYSCRGFNFDKLEVLDICDRGSRFPFHPGYVLQEERRRRGSDYLDPETALRIVVKYSGVTESTINERVSEYIRLCWESIPQQMPSPAPAPALSAPQRVFNNVVANSDLTFNFAAPVPPPTSDEFSSPPLCQPSSQSATPEEQILEDGFINPALLPVPNPDLQRTHPMQNPAPEPIADLFNERAGEVFLASTEADVHFTVEEFLDS
ncbi:hypothetical protein BU23DRAFT_574704 [Bimuria novae-zelandiae CBS 107.79]|uniref:Uncharacterized protein n=1 Tax=Bimuria novae-zelandiae CBS 107.79 TaxID=1447943 RepID=A0A6A5UL54_9PLEO|nr:hypothetical protein BU23DRAFT_574704 [Bimuria novae-zelandiae CBS 107.79]